MRVVAVADSDSYVKWAAALLTRMPDDWDVQLVVVSTAKEPSRSQLAAALSGSRIDLDAVQLRDFASTVTHVASELPDIVLLATIGPLADLLAEGVLDEAAHRPVIVSGLPGIALPARRKALVYRSQVDLIVLHSTRELRRFGRIAAENGFDVEFALATLPFLEVEAEAEAEAGQSARGDVLFAAQAIVPASHSERAMLLGWLIAFARSHPDRRVVIKVRAVVGEGQTHDERVSYPALLAALPDVPDNLVVEGGPMRERLRTASGLVTVSSTAAIEAIAFGVPVLAISDFGVSPELINEVFAGSGLLGTSSDLLAADFRRPTERWLAENYFHAAHENTWLAAMETLVARNRAGGLARRERVIRGAGGGLRRAWDRKRVLGTHDRSPLGYLALAIGMPIRTVVLAAGELRLLVREEAPSAGRVALDHAPPALPHGSRPTRHSR